MLAILENVASATQRESKKYKVRYLFQHNSPCMEFAHKVGVLLFVRAVVRWRVRTPRSTGLKHVSITLTHAGGHTAIPALLVGVHTRFERQQTGS